MADKKQYGLIYPKKNQLSAPKAGNVFGQDDDSEEDEGTDWVKKALKAENKKNKIKRQTQLNIQKALKEDATIFQYDEVYDEIERTKEQKSDKKVEKKPKYIQNLLKTAELRKKEQELRKDRIIQKEIEAEDAMFADKERYVTSSYKAKLEEMKQFEEEQANKDRLEAIGDVTKQSDMSGFYRHLYRQTVEKNEADLGITPEQSKKKDDDTVHQSDIDKDDPIPSDSESNDSKTDEENPESISKSTNKAKGKRQYRRRALEPSESESEHDDDKEDNIEKENSEKIEDKEKEEVPIKKQKLVEIDDNKKIEDTCKPPENESVKDNNETDKSIDSEKENNVPKDKPKPKPAERNVNIWKKRTVGPVYEAALQRYLLRKQERYPESV